MKYLFVLLLMLCAIAFKSFSQETKFPEGFKLKPSQNIVYAYRNHSDMPDFAVRNRWDHRFWFKVDNSKQGKYIDPITQEKFIRVAIISAYRYNDDEKKWMKEIAYKKTIKWKDEEYIDGSDFNTWLWISKNDFDSLKIDYYSSYTGKLVLSGLTAPFKFRPANNTQSNALINGDINLGTFIGYRLSRDENFGISIGGHLGISSISLNASNNTSITGNNTETMQGFSYGYGAIIDLKKQFQLGLIIGYDYGLGNLAKSYVYQQKSWLSFSLNYKFLDFFNKKDNTNSDNNSKDK